MLRPEQAAVRNESTRRDNNRGLHLYLFAHSKQNHNPSTHPCSTTGRSFAYAQTLYYSLPIEKKGLQKTRHNHDHDHVSSKKKFVLQMFFNYHKTSEPNNNKIKHTIQQKKVTNERECKYPKGQTKEKSQAINIQKVG